MNPGTIIFDRQYTHQDGTPDEKLIVILNDGSTGHYVGALITSQSFRRPRKYGCQADNYYPGFFLPQGSCRLRKDSWVALGLFIDLDPNEMLHGKFSGRIDHIDELPIGILKELLACSIDCKDITLEQEQILIDTLNALP